MNQNMSHNNNDTHHTHHSQHSNKTSRTTRTPAILQQHQHQHRFDHQRPPSHTHHQHRQHPQHHQYYPHQFHCPLPPHHHPSVHVLLLIPCLPLSRISACEQPK